MKFIYMSGILLCLVFLNSCSKVITIDLPPHESRLVVFGELQQGSDRIQIWVAHTIGVTDTTDLGENTYWGADSLRYAGSNWVTNAVVQLYENDQLIATLTPNSQLRVYETHLSSPFNGLGKTYRLEVSAENYPSTSATLSFPRTPQYRDVSYQKNVRASAYGDSLSLLKLTLEDHAETGDYYSFEMNFTYNFISPPDTFLNRDKLYLFSQNPFINGYSNGPMLTDTEINGQAYPLEFNNYSYQDPQQQYTNQRYYLTVSAYNQAFYFYQKTLSSYYEIAGNPFAEPVVIYSNIENGRGLFFASNHNTVEVHP